MNNNNNEFLDDLGKLLAETMIKPLGEHEFTTRTIMERRSIDLNAADTWVRRQVESGTIIFVGKRKPPTGRKANAYVVAPRKAKK